MPAQLCSALGPTMLLGPPILVTSNPGDIANIYLGEVTI